MNRKVAIYPGSFDPFTNGHINIIERGVKVFDNIIVAIAHNTSKKTTFTIEERVEIIREVFQNRPEVKVDYFQGLLVEYAKKMGTNIVFGGMRTLWVLEKELKMAFWKKPLYPEIKKILRVTEGRNLYISSPLI